MAFIDRILAPLTSPEGHMLAQAGLGGAAKAAYFISILIPLGLMGLLLVSITIAYMPDLLRFLRDVLIRRQMIEEQEAERRLEGRLIASPNSHFRGSFLDHQGR